MFWSAFLIHGVEKMPRTTGLKMGTYLGYFKAGSRPEYARRTGGIQERDDRLESYREGRAPLLWPSFDPIHYYPKNFVSLGGAALRNYVEKSRDSLAGAVDARDPVGREQGQGDRGPDPRARPRLQAAAADAAGRAPPWPARVASPLSTVACENTNTNKFESICGKIDQKNDNKSRAKSKTQNWKFDVTSFHNFILELGLVGNHSGV